MLKKLALAGALCCALAAPALGQSAVPPFSGAVTVSTSTQCLSGASSQGVVLKADYSNVGTIFIGPPSVTTATGYPLKAGEAISYGATSLTSVCYVGTNTTDVLHDTGN